jgi:hypothetical protein
MNNQQETKNLVFFLAVRGHTHSNILIVLFFFAPFFPIHFIRIFIINKNAR